MKFTKKNGAELIKVKNPNAFKDMKEIMSDLLSDKIFYFMQGCAANTNLENKFENWLTKHYRDYAFKIVVDKNDIYYAVAYANDNKAAYAVEVTQVEESEENENK